MTYTGKDILNVHLTRRQVPAESVFDGVIIEFGDHKYEACDNLD